MAASRTLTVLVAILVTTPIAQAADLQTVTCARMFVTGALAVATFQPALVQVRLLFLSHSARICRALMGCSHAGHY